MNKSVYSQYSQSHFPAPGELDSGLNTEHM